MVLSCRCSVRLTCYGGMCIAQVNVQRYGPLPFNGYDWTITFVSNPGALVLLVAIASWLLRVLTVLLFRRPNTGVRSSCVCVQVISPSWFP